MNSLELRASLGLAGIYALRMLGMFLILPVFAIYAQTLHGADNHTLIGLALGSYGLTQALLQLPLGMLSDRIGRKKVIYGGLLLFAIGSFVAAGAHDIVTLTIGRVIQGSGAISAAITALLADLTREENRTRAMAMIGMSIGTTFAVSLVAGPLLAQYIGVNGIFALTGVLSLAALVGVWLIIPNPAISRFHSDTEANTKRLPAVLKNPQLLRLNYGIFALHAAQMAMFVTIPFALIKTAGLDKAHHWEVYLPVTVIGFLLMVPAIIYGEKKSKLKQVFIAAIAIMTVAQLGMALALDSFWQIVVWLGLYFIAFNILEATLPSLISKIAPADAKGTAIGVYNTAQSFGLFMGAAAGGWLYGHYGAAGVFGFTSVLMASWLLASFSMQAPQAVRSVMFHIGEDWRGSPQQLSQQLSALAGVSEAVVVLEDRVAYLKVSQQSWDEAAVKQLIQATY
ncbi:MULTISPECIES: MFS transporter [Aquitalea]|uniref:Putative MFS family arabinose efflux permease n=1 Tax=Aquitalea magnusonii TaxID=332411 RepID=A0A318JQU7_9NEIS|nr:MULTISPECIES: MFS transporter [Aquitalea]PXX51027.1 putative MFS family arabinose efflux permease [Aquitalea magnusonii]